MATQSLLLIMGVIPSNNSVGWTVGGKFSDMKDAHYIYGSTSSPTGYYTPGAIQSSIILH
ncbi:hypothetical protein [Chryseobacterium chendengshani]|uniref:hypothetical protein n=1 Tax=Chryseobacterium sp. LJ756 TaxID=2864113 RepID=UPI001C642F38|nr:hypothetical protein [Chryseobacterium sp. LJ756]MBW7674180.1 hypothetical protein [Chryseobacterium sp. LJ756]